MGFTVELPVAWEPYKAARAALANTTQPNNIRALHGNYLERMGQARRQASRHLLPLPHRRRRHSRLRLRRRLRLRLRLHLHLRLLHLRLLHLPLLLLRLHVPPRPPPALVAGA
jgi:hypothetical protein